MNFIYDIGIKTYSLAVNIAGNFNPKAKLFHQGRINLLQRIEKEVNTQAPIIWFHCSSVGEFEQARPIIEWYKSNRTDYKIILTFFSPSGYELRKHYELADWIYYMPLDTYANANKFVSLVKPKKAIFIKYEFWYNYLRALEKYGTKVYIISAIFRPSQMFFKWYGAFFKRMLRSYTHFFVQDEQSANLLKNIGFQKNVSISGDTRFDRVYKITNNSKEFPLIKEFSSEKFTLIAGSSWPADEVLLAQIMQNFSRIKLILAPHEIDKDHISKIEKTFAEFKPLKFSSFDAKTRDLNKNNSQVLEDLQQSLKESRVLIIDCLGILSSIYRYATITYIGGGFGVGIHNILEAATYGKPIIFGPNYHKFKEAKDLVKLNGAHSINNYFSLYDIVNKYVGSKNMIEEKGKICKQYVENNLGATNKVVHTIEQE